MVESAGEGLRREIKFRSSGIAIGITIKARAKWKWKKKKKKKRKEQLIRTKVKSDRPTEWLPRARVRPS